MPFFNNIEQKTAFAEGLKELIRMSNIKQKGLASIMLVEERVVSSWVNGTAFPNFDNLLTIIKVFEDKGFNPLQALFPSLLVNEVSEIKRRHAMEIADLEVKEKVEDYKELDVCLDQLQEKYNSLNNKYKAIIDRIIKLSNLSNDKEDLLEYLIMLEKEDKYGKDSLVDILEKTIDEL